MVTDQIEIKENRIFRIKDLRDKKIKGS